MRIVCKRKKVKHRYEVSNGIVYEMKSFENARMCSKVSLQWSRVRKYCFRLLCFSKRRTWPLEGKDGDFRVVPLFSAKHDLQALYAHTRTRAHALESFVDLPVVDFPCHSTIHRSSSPTSPRCIALPRFPSRLSSPLGVIRGPHTVHPTTK